MNWGSGRRDARFRTSHLNEVAQSAVDDRCSDEHTASDTYPHKRHPRGSWLLLLLLLLLHHLLPLLLVLVLRMVTPDLLGGVAARGTPRLLQTGRADEAIAASPAASTRVGKKGFSLQPGPPWVPATLFSAMCSPSSDSNCKPRICPHSCHHTGSSPSHHRSHGPSSCGQHGRSTVNRADQHNSRVSLTCRAHRSMGPRVMLTLSKMTSAGLVPTSTQSGSGRRHADVSQQRGTLRWRHVSAPSYNLD